MSEIFQILFGISGVEQVPGYELFFSFFAVLKWLFILADAALFAGIIYAFRKGWAMRPHLEFSGRPEAKPQLTLRNAVNKERWQKIQERSAGGSPDSLRIAVIEADALVNDVLKQAGLEGEHMADRLSQLSPDEVASLPRLWRAHRVRNDLVHTPGFFLSPEDARILLGDFEAFLREFQAI